MSTFRKGNSARRAASGSGSGSGSSSLQLRKKKKSMSEIVNEQMSSEISGRSHRRSFGGAEDEDGVMGVAEEYEWRHGHDDDMDGENDDGIVKSGKQSGLKRDRAGDGSARSLKKQKQQQQLRRRGPLDPSLSEGKYAAEPVGNVEAMMDDIFGDLDMGDMDAEAEEVFGEGDDDFDNEDGSFDDEDEDEDEEEVEEAGGSRSRKPKRVKKAKDLTEEEYAEFLAEKRKRRRTALAGSGLSLGLVDGEEGAILEQLEGLRQAQMGVVGSNGSGSGADSATAAKVKSEAAMRERTQDAVKHFIMLYSQLLRIRVRLQPAVTKAISFPQYYAKSLFTEEQSDVEEDDDDEEEEAGYPVETACAYDDVVAELLDLLATLYSLTTPGAKKSGAAKGDDAVDLKPPTFSQIRKFHTSHVKKQADACLEYWGSKLVQTNSAKLKTIAQPLPQQIESILANMPRLRSKVQKNRAHLPILAHPDHERAAAAKAAVTTGPSSSSSSSSLMMNGAAAAPAVTAELSPSEAEALKKRNAEATLKRAMAIAEGDHDEEVFDDSDFLRELVRRGGAVAHKLEQQLLDLNRETLPTKEASRKGFHRMTKGKEVNYEPRPKLVGFLAAESFENTGRNDVVLKSLFQ